MSKPLLSNGNQMSNSLLPKGSQQIDLFPGLPDFSSNQNYVDSSHWARDSKGDVAFCNCPLINGICEKTHQSTAGSTLKCECGADKTYGETEDPKAHSSWCPKGIK